MRKHKLYGLIGMVMLLGTAIVACETSDIDRTFEGPYFVRFTDTTVTYKESYSKPIAIQVHNVGPILDQPITVNYVISGTAREGKEYTIVGTKGTVVIPAKASSGNIMVQLINNANNILESTSLTFTLTSVQPSTLQVGFGQNNVVGKTLALTIQDDCLLGGSYTGTQKYGAQTATVPNIAITSTDCKNYLLSNWNIGLINFVVVGNSTLFSFDAEKPTLTFIDNGDNSLTVPSQSNSNLGTNGSLSGSGAWNPRNRQISLNLRAKVQIGMTQNNVTTYRDTTLLFTQTYIPQ